MCVVVTVCVVLCNLYVSKKRKKRLTVEFFRVLKWFATFFKQFNGVVYYDVKPVQAELYLDACLTGFGGIFDNQCYALPIPKKFNNYSIVHLEMLNIVVALKIWATQWSCKKLQIKCDNMAVVDVLTSGRTKDPILGSCAHNIWLISAIFNISIHIEHIPGKKMLWLTFYLGLSLILPRGNHSNNMPLILYRFTLVSI